MVLWNDKNVNAMTGGPVKLDSHCPSVWTGKNMARWFSLPNGERMHWDSEQVQPNGIDLTVDKLFYQTTGPTLTKDKQFIDEGYLLPMTPSDLAGLPDDSQGWFLDHFYYVVEWTEVIHIPKNAIGLVFPRSTLLRLGGTIFTAVWDRGYKGKGRSGLFAGTPMLLERGTRLGQMIFIDAQEDEQLYDGTYQGENLNDQEKEND